MNSVVTCHLKYCGKSHIEFCPVCAENELYYSSLSLFVKGHHSSATAWMTRGTMHILQDTWAHLSSRHWSQLSSHIHCYDKCNQPSTTKYILKWLKSVGTSFRQFSNCCTFDAATIVYWGRDSRSHAYLSFNIVRCQRSSILCDAENIMDAVLTRSETDSRIWNFLRLDTSCPGSSERHRCPSCSAPLLSPPKCSSCLHPTHRHGRYS